MPQSTEILFFVTAVTFQVEIWKCFGVVFSKILAVDFWILFFILNYMFIDC